MSQTFFADTVLRWFDQHGRHDLPWQHPRTPYRVWLSEIMLQQTQVSVVIPYFQRFVAALNDIPALAQAPQDQVMALWSGLGYYSRARNLQRAAQLCVDFHQGELPRDFDALLALPGIGRSTAGAILSQAWGERYPILDGNVKRVLTRYHGIEGWPGTPAIEKNLWATAWEQLPNERLADYTQALMDFGATLCTRRRPACVICPLQQQCVAFRESTTHLIPASKPKKTMPVREAWVVLCRKPDNRLLLCKRPAAGIWAALWSLPQFETQQAALNFIAQFGKVAPAHTALESFRHTFSHYHLDIHPLLIDLAGSQLKVADENTRWLQSNALDTLGIPAPIRKLLAYSLN